MLKHALFAIGAAILIYQVSTIGLANNGDFPRMAGRLSLCPEGGWGQNRFTYFVARYVQDPACYWDSRVPTAVLPIVCAARILDPGPVFHIRYLGFLQAALLLPLLWWNPWAGLLFLDVSYIAYCNSFYLEAASLLFLLCTIAAAMHKHAQWFAVAALLLVTSKTQHAYLAIPLAVYALYSFRGFITSAIFLTAAGWMILNMPLDYNASNLWNSVFVSLLPDDPGALQSLNVPAEYTRFVGQNAYQFPDQATADHYVRAFYSRCGYRSLIIYYASHPTRAARRVWKAAAQLHHVRPSYLGIYERNGRRWPTYSWWSDSKSALYRHAPWLAVVIFTATFVLLRNSPHRPILAMIAAMALIEFCLSCFGDSIFDYRHNFLVHALTDIWVCFAVAALQANDFVRSKILQRIPRIHNQLRLLR